MKNIYFPDEDITENDLFFVCSMIERVARHIKQRNKYVVNRIGYDNLLRQLSIADTLHSENPRQVVDDWIDEYQLENGNFDITDVDKELCTNIPTPLDMGKVYTRLILQTRLDAEDYANVKWGGNIGAKFFVNVGNVEVAILKLVFVNPVVYNLTWILGVKSVGN